jgi:hypothetical protein
MSKKDKIQYEITEVLGIVSPTEDLKTRFAKGVIKSLWNNNGTMEEGLDIRRFDEVTKHAFGGIRLTLEEAHKVCDILLEQGYGSTEVIKQAYEKRLELHGGKIDNEAETN